MDQIRIDGIRALGTHGILPEEHARAQPFQVDVRLFVDLASAGRSDSLDDTVDYGLVTEEVVRVIEGEHCELIEALAGRIAELCLTYPGVVNVRVRVTKMRPPIAQHVQSVSVVIQR
ncbi:MAG: dihydroneopterin aldolase [Acidimicrobiia bacterium]|nr:dihydroneopterin aldolase [Acidimicrobiia bacterium]MBP8180239.1 dihydroneopterin aldolase [Acidimicrobiia bacterium]